MPPRKTPRPAPLLRNRTTFEFFVRYPHGSSAISGYRRAARHFGLHTKDDPCFEGSDAYRVFIHRDPRKLRAVAKAIGEVNCNTPDNKLFEAENDVFDAHGVSYFSHDWRFWDIPNDELPIENLGWRCRVAETTDRLGNQIYRVTLIRKSNR